MAVIALTPGCPAGIGPELFPVALQKANIAPNTRFFWCGSVALFEKHACCLKIQISHRENHFSVEGKYGTIYITATLNDAEDPALSVVPGHPGPKALLSQKNALLKAIALAKNNQIQAIVTGPIRKAALLDINQQSFSGQTELLHHYLPLDKKPPLMCFSGYDFMLGLATVHVSIKQVSNLLTIEHLQNCLIRLNQATAAFFQLDPKEIRLAILGLNPHAGENGIIGNEEITLIRPAIAALKKLGLHIAGPLPADGFFGHLSRIEKDKLPHAVLAMYHDQGLVPYKLLGQGKVTNITFGLTVPRTSPSHGTADDIAGRYVAKPDSLIAALELAEKLAVSHP
jgi:4-hydroxythreonine-4-phosphate dehydrogenase